MNILKFSIFLLSFSVNAERYYKINIDCFNKTPKEHFLLCKELKILLESYEYDLPFRFLEIKSSDTEVSNDSISFNKSCFR